MVGISLASQYKKMSLDVRQSTSQNEFQNSGGSPSKALMKHYSTGFVSQSHSQGSSEVINRNRAPGDIV